MGKGSSLREYGKIAMIVLCPIMCAILVLVGCQIAKITVGAVYFHDCSIENMIPIYLIVSALLPLLFCGLFITDEDGNCRTMCAVVGLFCNLAWLICELTLDLCFNGFWQYSLSLSRDGHLWSSLFCVLFKPEQCDAAIDFLTRTKYSSVWVYLNFIRLSAVDFKRCYGNVTTDCLENICNKTLITFAFTTVTIELILVSLWLFCAIYMIRKYKHRRK